MKKAIQILSELNNSKLVIGVSGGVDSMSLLHLILNCTFIDKKNIIIAHIDHNIRQTSKRDSQLVEDFCKKNDILCKIFSADIISLAKKNRRSIETEARLYRKQVFFDLCEEFGAKLVLAHNCDDQAETILMHILRGSGISGLKGMNQDKIIRPFLYTLKKTILEYAQKNNVPYYEDETNTDLYYSRNLIRSLLNQVENKYKKAKNNIARLGEISQKTENYLLNRLNYDYLSKSGNAILLNINALNDEFLAEYYVMEAIKRAGIECDLEKKHIDAVIKLKDKQSGKRINLIHNLTASRERENISFYKNISKEQSEEIPLIQGENLFCGHTISLIKSPIKPIKGQIIVDLDKLEGCVIRFRREGDKFTPCNSKSKKLKQYFVEKGIENRLKDDIPLICRQDEVLIICNLQLSDKVKITESTKNAVQIKTYGKN